MADFCRRSAIKESTGNKCAQVVDRMHYHRQQCRRAVYWHTGVCGTGAENSSMIDSDRGVARQGRHYVQFRTRGVYFAQ